MMCEVDCFISVAFDQRWHRFLPKDFSHRAWRVFSVVGAGHTKGELQTDSWNKQCITTRHLSTKESTQGYWGIPHIWKLWYPYQTNCGKEMHVTPICIGRCIYLMDTNSVNHQWLLEQGQDWWLIAGLQRWSSPVRIWSGAVERLALTVHAPPHGERSCNANLMDSRWLWTWVFVVLLPIFHWILRVVTAGHVEPASEGGWPPVRGVDEGAGRQDQSVGQLTLHLLLPLLRLAEVGEEEQDGTPGQNERHPHCLHDSLSQFASHKESICIICSIWSSEVDMAFPQSVLAHDSWWRSKNDREVMTCPEKPAQPTGGAAPGALLLLLLLASSWGIIAHTLNFRPLCVGETTNVCAQTLRSCAPYFRFAGSKEEGQLKKGHFSPATN